MDVMGDRAPLWDCYHHWVNTGEPAKYWASGGTDEYIPADAPIYQERRCIICGGNEWHVNPPEDHE